MESYDWSFTPCGIPWYRRRDYPEVLRIMEDGDRLPPTFDEWIETAEAQQRQLEFLGEVAVKAYIDPRTFRRWCRERGHRADSTGRDRFAATIARNLFRAPRR